MSERHWASTPDSTRRAALLKGLALSVLLCLLTPSIGAVGYGDPECADDHELGVNIESLVTNLGTYHGNPQDDHIVIAKEGRGASLRGCTNSRYLRAQIEIEKEGSEGWYIAAHDSMGRLLETLTPDRFVKGSVGRGRAWTSRYYHKDGPRNVTLRGYPDVPTNELRASVLAFIDVASAPNESQAPFYSARDPGNPVQQGLFCGGTVKCDFPVGREIREFGANVAFIIIHTDSQFNGPSVRACTGLAIPPDYVLTNSHCGYEGHTGWDAAVCLRTFVDLSWDDDGVASDQQCSEFVHDNKELDLAVFRVKSVVGETPIPKLTFLAATCDSSTDGAEGCLERNTVVGVTEKGGLFVVHHSRGQDKQLSFGCNIVEAEVANWREPTKRTDFAHNCDTFPGGSGAPLLDSKARVVGIHHLGYPLRVGQKGMCLPESNGTNKAIWGDEVVRYLTWLNDSGRAKINFEAVRP